MSSPTIVLFDLGNVLVSIQPGAFTRHLGIEPSLAHRKYQKRIVSIVRRYEGGIMTTEDYLNEISALFEGRFPKTLLREAMMKVMGEPIPGMEVLLRSVAAKTETALVSNTNELHFRYCQERFEFLSLLRKHFVSYQLGTLKPNPHYYEEVLRAYSLPVSHFVFIDDLAENIQAAEETGMRGIRFTNARDLKEELMALSLL